MTAAAVGCETTGAPATTAAPTEEESAVDETGWPPTLSTVSTAADSGPRCPLRGTGDDEGRRGYVEVAAGVARVRGSTEAAARGVLVGAVPSGLALSRIARPAGERRECGVRPPAAVDSAASADVDGEPVSGLSAAAIPAACGPARESPTTNAAAATLALLLKCDTKRTSDDCQGSELFVGVDPCVRPWVPGLVLLGQTFVVP
ncbi:MAG: hypothetical protein WCP30_13305 [Mycobacteriaceae bacterium]